MMWVISKANNQTSITLAVSAASRPLFLLPGTKKPCAGLTHNHRSFRFLGFALRAGPIGGVDSLLIDLVYLDRVVVSRPIRV